MGGGEDDENRLMLNYRYAEVIMPDKKQPQEQRTPEQIMDDMIRKSIELTGGNENERI